MQRRTFMASFLGLPVAPLAIPFARKANSINRLKTSLNAFSFNDPLSKGAMTIDDMLLFCAEHQFQGVDITGYYFKGYPDTPVDDHLYEVKRRVFDLGLEISGTGVRNDFTFPDKDKRTKEVELVKRWVLTAAKLGAPVLRIFSGSQRNPGIPKEEVTKWLIEDIQTCVEFGKQHGVIIGLQNHNDFIQTADELNKIVETINSPWLGIILDTGSYRVYDPYEEITKSIKFAVNWQIKEKVFINGKEVDTDLQKLMSIIASSDYHGYIPIETLGQGDPKQKIIALLHKLENAMEEIG